MNKKLAYVWAAARTTADNPALIAAVYQPILSAFLLGAGAVGQSAIQTAADAQMATFDHYSGANTGTISRTAATSQKNLRQLLEEAKRRLPDAAAAWYSTSLVIAGELAWDEVVVRTVALARSAEAREALEVQCGARVESWRRNTAGSVARLKPTQRQEFETIFAPSVRH